MYFKNVTKYNSTHFLEVEILLFYNVEGKYFHISFRDRICLNNHSVILHVICQYFSLKEFAYVTFEFTGWEQIQKSQQVFREVCV